MLCPTAMLPRLHAKPLHGAEVETKVVPAGRMLFKLTLSAAALPWLVTVMVYVALLSSKTVAGNALAETTRSGMGAATTLTLAVALLLVVTGSLVAVLRLAVSA